MNLDTVVQYVMHFRRSSLFLIREKHPDIDIFGINFDSMKGNNIVNLNDGSTITHAGEVKDEGDDLEDAEDMEYAFDAKLISADPTKDLPLIEVNAPSFFIIDDIPHLPHCK